MPSILCVALSAALAASPPAPAGRVHVYHLTSRVLHAVRTVRVWTPPGFRGTRRYPVLYLNDGQDVFAGGEPRPDGGSWHADTTAAALVAAGAVEPLILVAIDNAGDRARGIDYLPVPDPSAAPPAPPGADRYLDFVIHEVMPFVAARYPTRHGAAHTGFGGSSYGAVVVFYAIMTRPGVFGRALLESPSVAVGRGVLLRQAQTVRAWSPRIAVGVGTGERRGVDTVRRLAAIFERAGLTAERLAIVVQPGAGHDRAAWASRFGPALRFLFPPRAELEDSRR